MKTMNHSFPPIKDLEEMRERKGIVNVLLPKNASFLDEMKYEICQKILAYQQDNHLTYEQIAHSLGLPLSQTIEILRGNFTTLSLDTLVNSVEVLNLPLTVKIIEDKSKTVIPFIN